MDEQLSPGDLVRSYREPNLLSFMWFNPHKPCGIASLAPAVRMLDEDDVCLIIAICTTQEDLGFNVLVVVNETYGWVKQTQLEKI